VSNDGNTGAGPGGSADESSTRTRRLVIVRRHHFAAFSALARTLADEPEVTLLWDRRVRDRRAQTGTPADNDRRRTERRANQNAAWTSGGYLVLTVRSEPATFAAGADDRPAADREAREGFADPGDAAERGPQ